MVCKLDNHGFSGRLTNFPQTTDNKGTHQPLKIRSESNGHRKESKAQKSCDYKRLPSPRSAIFAEGMYTRIEVASCMATRIPYRGTKTRVTFVTYRMTKMSAVPSQVRIAMSEISNRLSRG